MNNPRSPLIVGNWKMNTSLADASALARALVADSVPGVDVVACPPFPWLIPVRGIVTGSVVALGAQDCWPKPNGAYTGAVSTAMLRELATYVIAGHSERRQWFGESNELVREKVSAVLAAELTPIVCVGESLETRESGAANTFVTDQLIVALGGRSRDEIAACVIAYEPIWAIGTGVAATAADAESMAVVIRQALDSIHGNISDNVRVLYGGSVTPSNCAATLGQPNVDGALVGGASLNAESFMQIVRSVAR